jgi:hypothetical protein
MSRVSFRGKCARTVHPLKLPSPTNSLGWVIFLQLASQPGGPPCRPGLLYYIFSLAGAYTTTLYVMVDIVKGGWWVCTVYPSPHNHGLIFPSCHHNGMYARKKEAVATLYTLLLRQSDIQGFKVVDDFRPKNHAPHYFSVDITFKLQSERPEDVVSQPTVKRRLVE